MNNTGSHAELACPSNISPMCDDAADKFVTDALVQLPVTTGALLASDDPGFLSDLPNQTRLDITQAALEVLSCVDGSFFARVNLNCC